VSASLTRGTRIGRYEVAEPVASGDDRGATYRARDRELERDVMIEVIAPSGERDVAGLLAAARAAAAIGHPALVPIFDVGPIEGGIYLVMPCYPGGTLHAWLAAQRRPWSAIVDRFIAAGRGLVAAHDAGLAHGEVSAHRMLVDRDDTLVAGIGLTAGGTADGDRRDLARALEDALDGRGPAWLTAMLAQRWPSLAAMLDRIEARRRRPVRVAVVAGALAAMTAAAVAVVATRDATPATCPLPAERIASVWSPQIRAELERAILGTRLPYAQDAVTRVMPAIDRYVADWGAMFVATCRATEVARTQPPAMLDRRMHCLDQRLAALRSRLPALLEADRVAVQKAAATMTALPAIHDCADEENLARIQPLPAAPVERASIARREQELAELQAFAIRGQPAEYLRRAHAQVAQTRLQTYVPLHIAALHVLADAQARNEEANELSLRELAAAAASAGDDPSLSVAWSSLVHALVTSQRFAEATQLVPAATTATARAGDRPRLRFQLRLATGALACETGDLTTCRRDLTEAVALAPSPTRKLSALYNLLSSYINPGDHAGGRPYLDQYFALAEELTGTNHPTYADALYLRSFSLQSTGDPADFDRARADLERALAIRVGSYGENHPDVAYALIQLAHIAGSQGRAADTEVASRRALAIAEALGHPLVEIEALRPLAAAVSDQGRISEARTYFDRALAKLRELYGPDAREVASVASSYAATLQQAKECAAALPHAAEAFRILDRLRDPQAVIALLVLGQCSVERGLVAEGVAHFERGLARCAAKGSCVTGHLETVQGYYGMWLVESGRDRRRGAELLRSARATFGEMGRTADVAEIDAFLAEHRVR
jgi:tetratricopeptide (TPR) repeat protein